MKDPAKSKLKKRIYLASFLVAALLVGYFSSGLIYKRTLQFRDCVAAKYDLRRETNFRFLTGACTALGKDGGQVYVNQLRAFGTDSPDHAQ